MWLESLLTMPIPALGWRMELECVGGTMAKLGIEQHQHAGANARPLIHVLYRTSGLFTWMRVSPTVAMYYDGSVSCWGRSHNGLYGNGDGVNSDRSSPVSFVSGFSPSGSIYADSISFLEGRTSLVLEVVGWGGDIVLRTSILQTVSCGMTAPRFNFHTCLFSNGFVLRENWSTFLLLIRCNLVKVESIHRFYSMPLQILPIQLPIGCTFDRNVAMLGIIGSTGQLASGNTGNQYLSTSYSEHPWTQLVR